MLKPPDLLCSMRVVEVVLSGNYAGRMLTKKGARSGMSSKPVRCFSRKRSSYTALGERFLTAVLHLEK